MNVLISGDSWSCGEWGDPIPGQNYYQNIQGVRHGGLVQYLREDGHDVQLIGQGSSCNLTQVTRMYELGKSLKKFDRIIWFHTDPLRDVAEKDIANSLQSLEQQKRTLDRKQYQRLQELNREILCLGGCSPINEDINDYSNLRVIIYDLQAWLLPGRETIDPLGRWWRYQAPDLDLLSKFEHTEQLLQAHIKRARDQANTAERELFWPDGLHPNREAHLRIYNHMKKIGIFV
jgi:hypothetical protein